MKLKGKVAVITGGTKGIGLGIAIEFVKEGASVVIGGRNPQTGEEGLSELLSLSGEAMYVPCDVGNLDSLQNIIDKTVEKFGKVDIYVSNAGINDPDKTAYLDISPDQYDQIMDVNLRGMFFGDQYAAREMVKQGTGGAIINMSSVNAYLALNSQMVYTTSKGGVQQLTKVQAVDLAPYGIKVNAIAPGPIDTELMRRVGSDKQLFDTVISRTPIGRIGTTSECGRLAVFLACEDSDFIMGQSIYNDGGRSFQAFPVPGYKTITDEDYDFLQQKREDQ
ncbi:MAG: SDR family oxidoreductase [Spirochaetales bacterium]|nr:SDR family oxidoreductase [Spirochaetales bacterium]